MTELEQIIKINRSFTVGDGGSVLFWEDNWFEGRALKNVYPKLYSICSTQKSTVAEVFKSNFVSIKFIRHLSHAQREAFTELQQRLVNFVPTIDADQVSWAGNIARKFTSKNLYQWLDFGGVKITWFQQIWDLHIPLKIKVFLVLFSRDRILTKVNLRKRGWEGSTKCEFCRAQETLQHLFFRCTHDHFLWQWSLSKLVPHCQINSVDDLLNISMSIDKNDIIPFKLICAAVLWNRWLYRNEICFKNGKIKSMKQLGLMLLSTLNYWAELWSEKMQQKMKELMPAVETLPIQLSWESLVMP